MLKPSIVFPREWDLLGRGPGVEVYLFQYGFAGAVITNVLTDAMSGGWTNSILGRWMKRWDGPLFTVFEHRGMFATQRRHCR